MERNMEQARDILAKGARNFALAMTFGAYHLYVINMENTATKENLALQHKVQLEELRKAMAEKRWW